jgi:hypothetical protein
VQTSPNYKWLVVAMLWLISFFNYADRQAIFSVFPLLAGLFRAAPKPERRRQPGGFFSKSDGR